MSVSIPTGEIFSPWVVLFHMIAKDKNLIQRVLSSISTSACVLVDSEIQVLEFWVRFLAEAWVMSPVL
jgi:hypothetical protein